MSLFRLAFVACLVILLLPTDAHRQAELVSTANSGVARAATFCERNPNTCAAGHELWSLFLRKTEFGIELAARLARTALSSAEPRQPETARSTQPAQRTAMPGRGTLPPADLGPEWRARNPRGTP
jgi:hypothetical protein